MRALPLWILEAALLGTRFSPNRISGTRVTINFLYAVDGWIGQVSLDGTNVTEINTNKAGVAVTDCLPLTWTSDVLIPGSHTVSVASLDPNLEIQATWVNINSFVYVFLCLSNSLDANCLPICPVTRPRRCHR